MADLSTLRLPTGLASIFGGAAPQVAPVGDAASYAVADPAPSAPPAAPSAWDVLPHMAMGKSLPDAYAAAQRGPPAFDPSALPAVPVAPTHTNRAGDVLDSLFLDGAFRKTRLANYAAARQGYDDQLARFGAIRAGQTIDAIPDPSIRTAAILNAAKTGEELAKNAAPQTLSQGQKVVFGGPGGPQVGNNSITIDPVSGKPVVTDPVTNVNTIGGSLGGGYSNDASGNVVSSRTGPTGQSLPTFHEVAPGARGDFVAPPGSGAGGDAPVAAGPVGAPAAGTRAARNNNPLNVKSLPNGQMWLGQTGTDANGFAQFSDPAMAIRAAKRNLNSYGANDGVNTITGVVSRWAPRSDGNDTANYIKGVAQALGVDPNAKIDLTNPQTQAAMVAAMQPFESGGTPLRVPAAGAARGRGGLPSSLTGGRYTVDPKTGVETSPTGQTSMAAGRMSPSDVAGLRDKGQTSKVYTDAVSSIDAWKSLTGNIGRLTGPAAYNIFDTWIRTINPGAVARQGSLEAAAREMGVPDKIIGAFQKAKGQGNLSLAFQQQLVDSVLPFVQSHYDSAAAINAANRRTAQSAQYANPDEATAPLSGRPTRYNVVAGRAEPNVGDVVNGYRYKGGSVTDPKSYVRVGNGR